MLGATPLSYALLGPDPVLVEALLNKGASVKERYGLDKATPLMWAAQNTSEDVVKILLSHGASVKDVDSDGMTALHYAFKNKSKKAKLDIVRLLIEAGTDVNLAAEGGLTPILMAALSEDKDGVRFLLVYGADPNKVYRAKGDSIPFVILLQPNTALIDAVTGGVTPLMLAATFGYKTVTDTLLQNGANPHTVAKGQKGSHTAITLALAGGHQELANRIRSYKK
ncbi:MAG TPA: ankyrin repeat domain-containing protein [Candidatus Tectomicrobia bacterium]